VKDWTNLGRHIATDRKRRRWLQSDLAEAAGLTKRTIGNYESGRGRDGTDDIPSGYYAVAQALGWPEDGIDRALAGSEPAPATTEPTPVRVAPREAAVDTALGLYPAVTAFARACAREGADPALRDTFEEVAERLLQSASAKGRPASYGLAAYRPHAWAEGDTGVPEDDALRIERRLAEYVAERENRP
jgi:transcriptional regulator with XRE-family HTH domain